MLLAFFRMKLHSYYIFKSHSACKRSSVISYCQNIALITAIHMKGVHKIKISTTWDASPNEMVSSKFNRVPSDVRNSATWGIWIQPRNLGV